MKIALLVFSILYLVYGGLLTSSVSAAETSSKSASLIDKINALKAEVASKAASLKAEVNKKLENKAYVGIITKVDSTSIVLAASTGTKNVLVNEYTSFQDNTASTKKTKPSFQTKDLKIDDTIAALGDVDDKEALVAKKVVKVKKLTDPPTTFWGQIHSLTNSTIMIQPKGGDKISITTTPQTVFSLGKEEASINDVKINKFLSGVGTKIKDNKTDARYIYLIPSSGYFKPEKIKAATTSASPSAKPKKN